MLVGNALSEMPEIATARSNIYHHRTTQRSLTGPIQPSQVVDDHRRQDGLDAGGDNMRERIAISS